MPLPQGCQRVEGETEGEQAARNQGTWTQNPAPERPGPCISPDPQQGEPPVFWEPGQLPLTTPPHPLSLPFTASNSSSPLRPKVKGNSQEPITNISIEPELSGVWGRTALSSIQILGREGNERINPHKHLLSSSRVIVNINHLGPNSNVTTS